MKRLTIAEFLYSIEVYVSIICIGGGYAENKEFFDDTHGSGTV